MRLGEGEELRIGHNYVVEVLVEDVLTFPDFFDFGVAIHRCVYVLLVRDTR